MVASSFSHIDPVGEGHKKFPLFKTGVGHKIFYPVLRGGVQNVSDSDFPIL